MNKKGKLLCAETKSGEIWASLIEKAYLKLVAGGYDLWTGSNSGIDVYALTGWPPESIYLSKNKVDLGLWSKIIRGLNYKENLVTCSSRSDINEEETGITRGHSFAVLEAKEFDGEIKKLLLRNPWGNYDGFWIDLNELPDLFQAIYVNWNLSLFPYVSHHNCLVKSEEVNKGFLKNTQFHIKLEGKTKFIWILLSRNISNLVQMENIQEALACHVFYGNQRIISRSTNSNLLCAEGKYCSGPHSLIQLENIEHEDLVLALSAFSSKTEINCTLSIFSTCRSTKVKELYPTLTGGRLALSGFINKEKDDPQIWVFKCPQINNSRIGSAILIVSAEPIVINSMSIEIWCADFKNRTKYLVSKKTTDNEVAEQASFYYLRFEINEEQLKRTSIRYLILFSGGHSGNFEVEMQFDFFYFDLTAPNDDSQQTLMRNIFDSFECENENENNT